MNSRGGNTLRQALNRQNWHRAPFLRSQLPAMTPASSTFSWFTDIPSPSETTSPSWIRSREPVFKKIPTPWVGYDHEYRLVPVFTFSLGGNLRGGGYLQGFPQRFIVLKLRRSYKNGKIVAWRHSVSKDLARKPSVWATMTKGRSWALFRKSAVVQSNRPHSGAVLP